MARFILALLAVAVTICVAPSIYAAPHCGTQDNLIGKVFFLESGKQEYLRQSFSEGNVEEKILSGGDTAAAISALLGVPPPRLLSSASSSRLDSLLSPNPFKRPHGVIALTIRGVISESPVSKEFEEILGQNALQQRQLSANGFQRPHDLPGQDVDLQALNYRESTNGLEQDLKALAGFLDGSFNKDEATEKIVLRIPLPLADDFSFTLDLQKMADWNFAEELLSLFQSTLMSRLRREQTQAKLFLGTFSALELMEEGSAHRRGATKLFLHTAARVLSALEEKYNGQMVGVFTLFSGAPWTRVLPLFSIKESRSSRSLLGLGDALAPSPSESTSNQTLYDAEIKKLLSRSLLVVTTLILLIATGLGSCFLLFMPLTRDTLLYANVKLD